jgi:acyl-CoA thioesterase-1
MCLSVGAWGRTIVVYGDSLSAAYGIAEKRGWVALLAERLKRERLDYSVVNASISGETSSGGRARIDAALARYSPHIVIAQQKPAVLVLELGANDGLRGLPVAQMKQNLSAMIQQAQKAGARVLVVGIRMPPNYGPDNKREFESAFAEVAKRHRAALVPFLFEGMGEDFAKFQPDRIHPTEAAQPILLDNVWKSLRPLLKAP